MTAGRTFNLAAKRKAHEAEPQKQYEPIEYTFEDDPKRPGGEPVIRVVEFKHPGDSALMLVAAAGGDGLESLQALFGVIKEAVEPVDFAYIKQQVRKGVLDSTDLMAMLSDAMEEWSGFPTQPSSDSPVSPPPTGGRSTGRARPVASTS